MDRLHGEPTLMLFSAEMTGVTWAIRNIDACMTRWRLLPLKDDLVCTSVGLITNERLTPLISHVAVQAPMTRYSLE